MTVRTNIDIVNMSLRLSFVSIGVAWMLRLSFFPGDPRDIMLSCDCTLRLITAILSTVTIGALKKALGFSARWNTVLISSFKFNDIDAS